MMQGYIGSQFDLRPVSQAFRRGGSAAFDMATSRNTGTRLRIASRRLYDSFLQRSAENIFSLEQRGDTLVLRYGTTVPYARIHEEGGVIRQQRTKQQQRFFWAMYARTNDPRWKAMALKKDGVLTIRIPARPYFAPAVERFRREGLPKITSNIVREFSGVIARHLSESAGNEGNRL